MIIPCRDEAGSIAAVVQEVPYGMQTIVVDNGSSDPTAEVAARAGAAVIREPRPGYGAAVDAGARAARRPVVCIIDGDGSMRPGELRMLLDGLDAGADLAVGRRRPDRASTWPWHARLGSAGVAWRLRRRHGIDVHDIGPMRAIGRDVLLGLDIRDRRSGYPVELLVRAAEYGLRVVECDVTYRPRTAGRSKVSGSVVGSWRAGRDFLAALP
ncbi:putative glycosyltransferase [Gordonia soli NBRC 108243]|uniref:Putative glycosyltransferase n=1 Tax=Gordonia soli NBRC 108243 TaxID=1223545 RepID=M0QE19_9ACTN|nr:putative glycosyltransferase [Gordonia soli NBRC 108243]